MVSYYEILGVKPTASREDIKKAYHHAMNLYHPDKHSGTENSIARIINAAYQVLNDTNRRNEYDKKSIPGPKRNVSGNHCRCSNCDGYGYSKTFGPNFGCDYCNGKGSVPGAKQSPAPHYSICSNCDGYGYSKTFGPNIGCDYCNGNGWIPGRKF